MRGAENRRGFICPILQQDKCCLPPFPSVRSWGTAARMVFSSFAVKSGSCGSGMIGARPSGSSSESFHGAGTFAVTKTPCEVQPEH